MSDFWIKYKNLLFTVIALSAVLIAAGIFLYFSGENYSDNNLGAQLPSESSSDPNGSEGDKRDIRLLFLGDIMLDRYIRQVAEKKGYDFVFGDTDNILEDKDLVIGNLEGPITSNESRSKNTEFGTRENLTFTFAPETAAVLSDHNIKLLNLGNNHILNFGENGLEQTEKYLRGAGVEYFGDKNIHYTLYKIHDTNLAFICYNQFESGAVEKTLTDIEIAKQQADYVILYTHWGKEYETSILPSIRILAHRFIDAGADLIIGSHPHVAQEKEIYNGKTIYYSLGNFIFDQYFDPNAEKGLAVEVLINPDGNMQFMEYQVQMKTNGQAVIISD